MSSETLRDLFLLKREALRRRERDPLLAFEPHDKQISFIRSVLIDKVPENWFIAANRSGKSDTGAYAGAALARFGGDPKTAYSSGMAVTSRATSGWVVSLDFPSSRDIIQPKYFDNGFVPPGSTHPPFIPDDEIEDWRVSDQILKLKNGSIIGFKSCDSKRVKFQGAGKDWIHFDEEPPRDIYEESVIRVEGGSRLSVFGTCTLLPPEGMVGGVTWVFSDIIQPWQAGQRTDTQLFGASIYDNPYIDPAEIRRLEALYPEGSISRRIRLNGEWLPGLSGARAYGNFDRRIHVRSQPPIILRRDLAFIWDFNVEPMVTLIGQRDLVDGRPLFRVHKELILEDNADISTMVEMFREVHPSHQANVLIFGDSSGKNRDVQTGGSSYRIILNAMSGYNVPVKLRIPEANPPVPDRINAVQSALKTPDGHVCLEIDPSCVELISDLEQVLLESSRGVQIRIKKARKRNDPYSRRTHSSDGLGYWVSLEAPVARSSLGDRMRRRSGSIPQPDYSFGG